MAARFKHRGKFEADYLADACFHFQGAYYLQQIAAGFACLPSWIETREQLARLISRDLGFASRSCHYANRQRDAVYGSKRID